MSRRIGRRLGLRFDHTAVDYLYTLYSGHPLLTRLALSYENQNALHKPISFTEKELVDHEAAREDVLIPYCQHIVDVLKDFYPEEYSLLNLLSVKDFQEFLHRATDPMMVKHLKNYGLESLWWLTIFGVHRPRSRELRWDAQLFYRSKGKLGWPMA